MVLQKRINLLLMVFAFCYSLNTKALVPYDLKVEAAGVLLQVLSDAPVMSAPDPKAKKIAVAEKNTVVMLVELSKEARWAKIEDDLGDGGWIPVDRTDLVDLLEAQLKIRQAEVRRLRDEISAKPIDEEKDDVQVSKKIKSNTIEHALSFGYAYLNDFYPGFEYSLQFKSVDRSSQRRVGLGIELARYNSGANEPKAIYEIRVNYKSASKIWNRAYYGPDIFVRLNQSPSSTTLGAAYRIGVNISSPLFFESRVNLSLRSEQRWGVSGILGLRF